MNIPILSKWLNRNKVKVYVADFITLEQRKARILALREMAQAIREQNNRD